MNLDRFKPYSAKEEIDRERVKCRECEEVFSHEELDDDGYCEECAED